MISNVFFFWQFSKRNEADCSSKPVVSNANVMPRISTMTTSPNGPSESAEAVPSSTVPHLQAPANASMRLSSNSSLNSSSVKSVASKSNDGASTDKKRKSLSSSRQKKFHRRFKQVAMEEEVINCTYISFPFFLLFCLYISIHVSDFSCAFVSDILLQGYLYITKNYIAFYSNVFGYVTKLLIPITSVVRISKEKTVKIIPNAIAVATADEIRHTFSSFLSREAAYQLMISVWREALPMSDIDLSSTSAQLRICTNTSAKSEVTSSDAVCESKTNDSSLLPTSTSCSLHILHHRRLSNSGVSEIDDESSSAVSGNELTHLLQSQKPMLGSDALLNPHASHSSSSSNSNSNSNPSNCDLLVGRDSHMGTDVSNCLNEATSLTSTPKAAIEARSARGDRSTISFLQFRIPRTIHIAYFGISLVIILALVAAFLFYRISEMKNTPRLFSVDDLTGVSRFV